MPSPVRPVNDAERVAALRRHGLLEMPRDAHLSGITELASLIAGTPMAMINLMTEEEQVSRAEVGMGPCTVPRGLSMCDHVVAENAVVYSPDLRVDPRFSDSPLVTGALASFRMYTGVPLHDSDGYVMGTLCVADVQTRELDEAQLMGLRRLAAQVVALFELHQRTERLTSVLARMDALSRTDSLTGLTNRRGVVEALEREGATDATVVFCDLDGFKAVNDVLGHQAGDEVLEEVARRLRGCVRADDVVARHGGDEFVVVVHALPEQVLVKLEQRIRRDLSAPYVTSAGTANIGVSVGVADMASEGTVEGLLRRADERMYTDKRSHRAG